MDKEDLHYTGVRSGIHTSKRRMDQEASPVIKEKEMIPVIRTWRLPQHPYITQRNGGFRQNPRNLEEKEV